MESWNAVWRKGFVPQLTSAHLEALRVALESDDPRLIQGTTTSPPPLQCVQDWPIDATDALVFGAWATGEVATVAEGEEVFAKLCYECDQILHEPAACRWFLNWYDETPRGEMRRELLGEVVLALEERAKQEAAA